MNLSSLIKRPGTTTLIMPGILVFGVMAYRQLPVSDLRRLPDYSGTSRSLA